MAVPVELEIFMLDLTKAGLKSAGKNIQDVETQTKLLITALEQVRASQLHQLEVNKAAGLSYTQEAANIQALTGQIKGLKAGLKDLEKAKKAAAEAPTPVVDVDTDAVMRKTNNLKMSFAQVARELPSLAMGPQMFFLAISNNLPMLADAISDVRKQNELLRASGQKSVPLWKQLSGALFSWNTALMAVISLSIVYGKEIGDWIKGLFNIKKNTDLAKRSTEAFNSAMIKGAQNAQKEVTDLRLLYQATQDATKPLKERTMVVDELQKRYPRYFSNLSNEGILAGKAASSYERLSLSIISAAKAQAARNKIVEEQSKVAEYEQKIDQAYIKLDPIEKELAEAEKRLNIAKSNAGLQAGRLSTSGAKMLSVYGNTSVQAAQTARNKLKGKADKILSDIAEYRRKITESESISKKLEKGIKVDDFIEEFGSGGKDYAKQLAEARLKAQQTVEKLRIQIMMDSREKRRAIAEQEYKETIADIDRTEKATIATLDKSRKQGDIVTDADYKAVRDNATTQRALQQLALNKELEAIDREYYDKAAEAMIAYNKEYGTYQEKRAAIAAEYAKKILKAETEGERLSLQKQYKKDINDLNFEEMKSGIDFAKVFGNIDIQSTESLKALQDKLYDYINGAAKNLSPENLKELQDAFKEIDAELLERNPFEGLKQRTEAMQNAAQELAKVKDELERVQAGEKVVDTYRTVTDAQGNTKIEKTYLTAEKALKNYNKAKEKSEETSRDFIKAEEEAKKQVDNLASSLREIGNTIGGEAGEILTLMGDITSFATTSIDGITKVTQTGAQAISTVEKASVILGIISAAIQMMKGISSLMDNFLSGYENSMVEKYKAINDLTYAVGQYAVAVAKAREEENNWFAGNGLASLVDAKRTQEEALKAYDAVLNDKQRKYQNKQGGGWLYKLFTAPTKALFNGGQVSAVDNLRIETRSARKGFLGIGARDQKTADLREWVREQGLGELFDSQGLINTDVARNVIDNYGSKLQGQTQETLERLIELREQYDEYIRQLREYVSSMYEPLVDNFVDGIWDWFDTGKSALDSFKEYASDTFRDIVSDMLRTIVLDKVVDGMDDKIADVYEEYSAGQISQSQLMSKVSDIMKGMIGRYESNIPVLENMLNNISAELKDAGIDLKAGVDTGVNQSPQSGALTTMSQDSIATFEGIGRRVQTHLISIDKVSVEIREQQKEDSKALVKIVENTSHILPIRELLEKMERDGIKLQ